MSGASTIRLMTSDDWVQVWPFFAEIVAAGESYVYPLDLTSEQAQGLWTTRPPGRTVVLEEDGRVLGTATMGPNRPGRGDHVGTGSFLVPKGDRGRGVGRRLGEYVVQWHRDAGFRAIQFNAVVETNTAAVALTYRRGHVTTPRTADRDDADAARGVRWRLGRFAGWCGRRDQWDAVPGRRVRRTDLG